MSLSKFMLVTQTQTPKEGQCTNPQKWLMTGHSTTAGDCIGYPLLTYHRVCEEWNGRATFPDSDTDCFDHTVLFEVSQIVVGLYLDDLLADNVVIS
jgi:hypothetical protein